MASGSATNIVDTFKAETGIVGLQPTGPYSSIYLYTKINDANIYIWDRANPGNPPVVAATIPQVQRASGAMETFYPRHIKRSNSGYFYVASGDFTGNNGGYNLSERYQITRYNLSGTTLYKDRTIVRSVM